MGKRGPRSRPKVRFIEPAAKRYPVPPPGMSKNARTVWHRVVKAFPPDHFLASQYDLLRVFSEASATHKRAMSEIRKQGEVIEQSNGIIKENPWVNVAVKAGATMTSLSVKLGLTINSTLVNRGKAPAAPKPKTGREHLLFGGKDRKN